MRAYHFHYIEYTSGSDTYLDIWVPALNQFTTHGPYTPKPGYCPRCRHHQHHTVGGVARCTNCRHYWPNPQQHHPGEVARIDMEEP